MIGAPSPRQEDAQRRIHELLAELVEIIGPNDDGLVEFLPGEEPVGAPTLREWVLVGYWADPGDDEQDWVTVLPAAGMPTHHTVGLLRAGLNYGHYKAADAGGEP